MGSITSRFRDKKSTVEILEAIEKEVSHLQKCRRQNQELQKRVAASLLLYSILLYLLALIIFYFFYLPDTWQDRALYSLPLLSFPLLIWGARKAMHWYFVKRLTANDLAVNELREKKKLILEDVMEKETYKKAKEILEKFDPARFKKLEAAATPTPVKATTPGTYVRQRVMVPPVSGRMMTPRVAGPPGVRAPLPSCASTPTMSASPGPHMPTPYRYSPPPGPPMPRSVLARDRGSMDKFIDFLVGDGPQNRYALICHYCKSHNGMALPEEFEYLSFRCCYCFNMNQAKKMRPFAPRLEFPEAQAPAGSNCSSSSEDDSDAEDNVARPAAEDGSKQQDSSTSQPHKPLCEETAESDGMAALPPDIEERGGVAESNQMDGDGKQTVAIAQVGEGHDKVAAAVNNLVPSTEKTLPVGTGDEIQSHSPTVMPIT